MGIHHGYRPQGNIPYTFYKDPFFNSVSLLLHGDGGNASTTFRDSSLNDYTVTPSGNAQISTSIVKYGTGSMYFDGTGDFLTVAANPGTLFGTNPFTVEFWLYANSFSTTPGIVSKGASTLTTNWQLALTNTGVLQFFPNGSVGTNGSTLSTATWYHIAIVGNVTTIKVYLNGNENISITQTYNYSDNSVFKVGVNRAGAAALNGYIDDLRVTNGVARYTTNFTPPTSAYPG